MSTSAAIFWPVASSSNSPKNSSASETARAQTSGSDRSGRSANFGHAAGDRDRPGLRIQPGAVAAAAVEDAHVLFQLAALQAALGGAILREQLGDDALELAAPLVARRPAPPGEGDVLVAGAPEQGVLQLRIEFLPGRFQHRARPAGRASVRAFRPRRDRCAAASGPSPSTSRPIRCSLAETSGSDRASAARDRTCRFAPARCTRGTSPAGC